MPGLSGTLHEVLMLNIETKGKKEKGKKGQKEHYKACVDRNIHKLREELQDCWFFVLDEMGMVGQLLLSILDYAFKKIRAADYPDIHITEMPMFGGTHIKACGDFYQLPPVGAASLAKAAPAE
ncbi:hypothetical protein DFJ74DRAFT_723440 [Hyaloraphidium curvatum]|nr:hypothetical protein DFJ74DRAFT_723440 [Hyaloraphidium curvatum]